MRKLNKNLNIKKLLNVNTALKNAKASKNTLLIASAMFVCAQSVCSALYAEEKKDEFVQDPVQSDLLDLELESKDSKTDSKEVPKTPQIIKQDSKKDKPKFFTFYGAVGSFNRFGFNNQSINESIGQYPTDSLLSIYTEGNIKLDLLHYVDNPDISKLDFVLGGALGGIVYDSTRKQAAANGGLGHWYVGYYAGFLGDKTDNIADSHNWVNHNLYIDFKWRGLGLKAGRYKSWMDQQSAYTQGFNIDYTFKFNGFKLKPWWFSSFGRAYAYAQWIYDWYSERTSDTNGDGTDDANLGKHAVGADFVLGGITKSEAGKSGYELTIRPYLWFYPDDFTAIGGRVIHEQYFNADWGMKLQLQGYYFNINDKYVGGDYDGDPRDKHSVNLNIVAEGFYKTWSAAIGIYKNFGHPNSRFGGYPIYIDKWTASVYDIGRSKADIGSRNALSEYFFVAKSFNTSWGTSNAKILARFTQSPRSDEISIGLLLGHTFKNALTIGLKLEYFSDTTHAGYYVNPSQESIRLARDRTDDRSHAFVTLDYAF